MKLTFHLAFAAFLMSVFISCREDISETYETPFPMDEIDAFFDIPYSSVTFVSNTGQTKTCKFITSGCTFAPFEPFIYGYDPKRNPDGSRGEEYYERRAYYMVDGNWMLGYQFEIFERRNISVAAWMNNTPKPDNWVLDIQNEWPSNKIWKKLSDKLILSGNAASSQGTTDCAYIEKGKGIVKFTRNNGTEIWTMKE